METNNTLPTPYADLTPEHILDAVESRGYTTSGALLALNSYENRVYRVGLDEAAPLIVKFYRPGRLSHAAILEEHGFLQELAALEIPVVPAIADHGGETLYHHGGFRFALFACRGGRAPDLEDPEHLAWLGRFIARIHAAGATARFQHRPSISIDSLGRAPARAVLASELMPIELRPRYNEVTKLLFAGIERCFERAGTITSIRLHGDCHPGNVLWTPAGPHFVDFDDCVMGPAIQDLWMMLSGQRDDMLVQLQKILEGYTQFFTFNRTELWLLEALRALRMIHYAGWLARRWDDPAFVRSFPWFNTARYWEDHIQTLREQIPLLDEMPLAP